MKLNLRIVITLFLTIINLIFLFGLTFLLNNTFFLILYSSIFVGVFIIPYIIYFLTFGKNRIFERWMQATVEGLLFSTIVVCLGWGIFSIIYFVNPYRILLWCNFYSMPLIAFLFAPFSYNLYNFFIASANISIDDPPSQKRKIITCLRNNLIEALPPTIIGALIINLPLFLVLFCVLFLLNIIFLKNINLNKEKNCITPPLCELGNYYEG